MLAARHAGAGVENVPGRPLGVPSVRERAEQDPRIRATALSPRARVAQRRCDGRRQLAHVEDLLAEVAPTPDDVVSEPGGVRAMPRVGDEDDRPIEGQELEDHARGVRQEDIARGKVWHEVGVRVLDQVHAAMGRGEPCPAGHPPRAPVSDDRVRLDDDVQARRLGAHEIDETLAQHLGRGKAEVPGRRVEQGRLPPIEGQRGRRVGAEQRVHLRIPGFPEHPGRAEARS